MPIFIKTKKRKYKRESYKNKKGGRHQSYKNKIGGRRQRYRNKIDGKESVNVWEDFNKKIINDSPVEKVNKFEKKIGDVENKIVYGKFWMEECGHCTLVKETWDLVVKQIFEKNKEYVNVDIRHDNIEEGKIALKKKTKLNEDINTNGYPCFYKIIGKQIYYYNKDRTVKDMKMWLLDNSETNFTPIHN